MEEQNLAQVGQFTRATQLLRKSTLTEDEASELLKIILSMERTSRMWEVAVSKTGRNGTWEDRGRWVSDTITGAVHAYERTGKRAVWELTAWDDLGGSPYYRVIDEDGSPYVFRVTRLVYGDA